MSVFFIWLSLILMLSGGARAQDELTAEASTGSAQPTTSAPSSGEPAFTSAAATTTTLSAATTTSTLSAPSGSTPPSAIAATSAPCTLKCVNGRRRETPFCRCECDVGFFGDVCERATLPCLWESCAACRLENSTCSRCPLEAAVLCPNGECVSDVFECDRPLCHFNASAAATGGRDFVCVAGVKGVPFCTPSPLTCVRKAEALEICPTVSTGCCWDGSLRAAQDAARCPPVPACPPLFVRCPDGRCRDSFLPQPCADDGSSSALLSDVSCVAPLVRCADARCYLANGSAPPCAQVPHDGCGLGQLACWSGRCVTALEECIENCPVPLWRCDDGSCSDACPVPRRLRTPTDFDVVVHGDAKSVFHVRSSGAFSGRPSILLATVTVPAGALARAEAPLMAPAINYASVTHTLRIRSLPTSEAASRAGGDTLLSAPFRIEAIPPPPRTLPPPDYITLEFPLHAVATPVLEKRELCLASYDARNASDTMWRCVARLALSKRDGGPAVPTGNATDDDAELVWRVRVPGLGIVGVRYVPLGPLETAFMVSPAPYKAPQPSADNEFVTALATALGVAAFICVGFALIGGVCLVMAQRRKRAQRQKREMQQMARAAAEADVVAGVPSAGASDRIVIERQRMLAASVSPLLMGAVDFLMMKGVFVRGIFADEPRFGTAVARKADALFRQWHGRRGSDAATDSEPGRSSYDDVLVANGAAVGTTSGATDSDGSVVDALFAAAAAAAGATPRSLTLRGSKAEVPEFSRDTDPLVIAHVVRLYFRSLHPASVFNDQFFRHIDRIPEYRAAPVPVSISSVLLATEMTSSYDGSDDDADQRHHRDRSGETSGESARSTTRDESPRAKAPAASAQLASMPPLTRALSRIDQLAYALQALDERSFLTLRLICNLLYQIHSNASINGMTAGDLQQALYGVLLPPSKGDYKAVIGDLIANFEYVFGTDTTDGDESTTDDKPSNGDSDDDLLDFDESGAADDDDAAAAETERRRRHDGNDSIDGSNTDRRGDSDDD